MRLSQEVSVHGCKSLRLESRESGSARWIELFAKDETGKEYSIVTCFFQDNVGLPKVEIGEELK